MRWSETQGLTDGECKVFTILEVKGSRAEMVAFAPTLAAMRSLGAADSIRIVRSELIPLFDPAALPAAAGGTFMGTLRVGRDVLACGEWTRGWLPQGFSSPVKSNVPALLMNGALDSLTPPRYGERVARSLVKARHLVLPERAHNDVDPCVIGLVEDFVLTGNATALDTSCLAKPTDLPFATQRDDLLGEVTE